MLSVAHLVTSTYSRPFLVHWKCFLLEASVSPCLRAFCSCRSMLSWKSSRMNNSWCSKLQPLMNNYLSFLVPWDDHSELCSTQFFSGSLVDMCSSCPQWQPINSPFTGFPPCPGWFHSLSWVSWTHSQASYISPNSCLWPAFRGTQPSLQTLAPPTGLQTCLNKSWAFLPLPKLFSLPRPSSFPFCGWKFYLSFKISQFILLLRYKIYLPLHDNLHAFAWYFLLDYQLIENVVPLSLHPS